MCCATSPAFALLLSIPVLPNHFNPFPIRSARSARLGRNMVVSRVLCDLLRHALTRAPIAAAQAAQEAQSQRGGGGGGDGAPPRAGLGLSFLHSHYMRGPLDRRVGKLDGCEVHVCVDGGGGDEHGASSSSSPSSSSSSQSQSQSQSPSSLTSPTSSPTQRVHAEVTIVPKRFRYSALDSAQSVDALQEYPVMVLTDLDAPPIHIERILPRCPTPSACATANRRRGYDLWMPTTPDEHTRLWWQLHSIRIDGPSRTSATTTGSGSSNSDGTGAAGGPLAPPPMTFAECTGENSAVVRGDGILPTKVLWTNFFDTTASLTPAASTRIACEFARDMAEHMNGDDTFAITSAAVAAIAVAGSGGGHGVGGGGGRGGGGGAKVGRPLFSTFASPAATKFVSGNALLGPGGGGGEEEPRKVRKGQEKRDDADGGGKARGGRTGSSTAASKTGKEGAGKGGTGKEGKSGRQPARSLIGTGTGTGTGVSRGRGGREKSAKGSKPSSASSGKKRARTA